jgi:PhnB protein
MAEPNTQSTPSRLGLTPQLTVEGGRAAIDFYKRAFAATELHVSTAPDSDKIMHATLLIHGSVMHLNDDFPEFMGGQSRSPRALGLSPVMLHLQVDDADAAWARAVEAGATPTMPLQVQFWGMKYGMLRDPFGHSWSIGEDVEQPSPQEVEDGARESFARASTA